MQQSSDVAADGRDFHAYAGPSDAWRPGSVAMGETWMGKTVTMRNGPSRKKHSKYRLIPAKTCGKPTACMTGTTGSSAIDGRVSRSYTTPNSATRGITRQTQKVSCVKHREARARAAAAERAYTVYVYSTPMPPSSVYEGALVHVEAAVDILTKERESSSEFSSLIVRSLD